MTEKAYKEYSARCLALKRIEDYDRLIAECTTAIAIIRDPPDIAAPFYLYRGVAYEHKGDYTRAIQDYEMSLKLMPDDRTYGTIEKAKQKQAAEVERKRAAEAAEAERKRAAEAAAEAQRRSLQEAAEQGQAEAQFKLGLLYFNGEGVPKDFVKAAEWFGKATGQGYPEAKDYLAKAEAAEKEKEAKEKEAAEKRAREEKEAAEKRARKEKKRKRYKIIRCIIGGIIGAITGLIIGSQAGETFLMIIIGIVLGVLTGIFTGESITGGSGFWKGAIIGAIGFAIISRISGISIFVGIISGAIGCGITGALTGAYFSNYES